jgi:hypothetical protein
MSTLSALLILCFVGFAFGIFASASERSGLGISVPVALGMMALSPVIGIIQHFWWGWPWWPVVIPAHGITAFAGIIFFNLMARKSREVERSHVDAGRDDDEYDLEDEWLEDDYWEDDGDGEEDDYWDVDGEAADSAEDLQSEDTDRRLRED